MTDEPRCPLCYGAWRNNSGPTRALGYNLYFHCERCTSFGAYDDIYESLHKLPLSTRRALVQQLSAQVLPRFADTPLISQESIDAASTRRIRITEMADRLIAYCVKSASHLGQNYTYDDLELMKACYALDRSEVVQLVNYLADLGYAKGHEVLFQISPLGYHYVEEGSDASESVQGFVAMWFNPELTEVFNSGFAKAIADSGYRAFRIDQKEHNQKIDDEIVAEIRRSRFLVADFTGHRGGVYFEAGFAHGLGLPIIWTCRKDDISGLHFDIRQYNCIDWDSLEDLRSRLSHRIVALLGQGDLRT